MKCLPHWPLRARRRPGNSAGSKRLPLRISKGEPLARPLSGGLRKQRVTEVIADLGIWVAPPHRAVWIPTNIEHEVLTVSQLSMRSLYVQPDYAPGLPDDCAVVNVAPLSRELILRAAVLPVLYALRGKEERLMDLILDETQELPISPLHLPEPSDSRTQEITTAITDDPADGRTLEAWASIVGASSRTLGRLFSEETNKIFQSWQRQARLLAKIVKRVEGRPVTSVALDVGYEIPSAFIAMFKRALGMTPGQYFPTSVDIHRLL